MAKFKEEKDGCWSVVVVMVALLSQVLVGGLCLTGGIFYVIFNDAFKSSATMTSWLCNLPNALWFFSSPVATILTNKFGYRTCTLIGGALATLGITISCVSPNVVFLFITFGFLGGLGTGIHYTGCLAAVNDYFDKYKNLATGIISVGHNVGQAVYSLLLVFFYYNYGWRGTCLLMGGITFHYCLFAIVMKPFRTTTTSNDAVREVILDSKEAVVKPVKHKSVVIRWNVLKKSAFLCFSFSAFLINVAESMYLLFLPSYTQTLLKNQEDMAIGLTIFGISNGIGKVIYSLCAQTQRVNSTLLYTISLVGVALCMALTSVAVSRHVLFMLVGACGFLYCVTGALVNAVMFCIVGYERFVDGTGVFLPFKGMGNLLGGALAGFIFDKTHDYHTVFYVASVSMAIACCLMIHPILYLRRKTTSGPITVEEEILNTDDS